jgi:hypothetical protein
MWNIVRRFPAWVINHVGVMSYRCVSSRAIAELHELPTNPVRHQPDLGLIHRQQGMSDKNTFDAAGTSSARATNATSLEADVDSTATWDEQDRVSGLQHNYPNLTKIQAACS